MLRRFHVKSKIDLNDQSRATYESRFRRAVEMYLKYLADNPSWKPASSKARATTPRAATSKPAAAPAADVRETPPIPNNGTVTPPSPGMIEFPIPLRPGVQGKLILPDDLTKKEAERVVKVVSALAIEERLAITAGPSGGVADQERSLVPRCLQHLGLERLDNPGAIRAFTFADAEQPGERT
jgi:hypothetical protein